MITSVDPLRTTLPLLRDTSATVDLAEGPDIEPLKVSDILPPEDPPKASAASNSTHQ